MSRHPPRIPPSLWRQGQVLRLQEPVCGLRPGLYAFIGLSGDKLSMCRLVENDEGDLCATEEVHELPDDAAESFSPTMKMGRI